jgi:hypothetical protein
MGFDWDDINMLVELLLSIYPQVSIVYNDLDEVLEGNIGVIEDSYMSYGHEINNINWEHGNTTVRIEPRYRYLHIKTPDLDLVKLIRSVVLGKNYSNLEISLSVP